MANGAVVTKNMKNVMLDRGFKATPTNLAYTQGSIGTGTTTPAEGDTALETVISSWNTTDFKDYATGFPSFDAPNKKVTVRTIVTSTQANSNTITEYGDFNKDGTPVIGGHFVFTGIIKTTSIQVFFTPTYKMV